MSTVASAELLKQIRPDIMTARLSTEKNSQLLRSEPVTGILLGSSIGSILWIVIILVLARMF